MNGTLVVPPTATVDTLGKAAIDVEGGENYTHMAKWEAQLFEAPPKVEDVRQGGIGNCFILGALMAVLQQPKGPEFVQGMMFDQWNPMAARPNLTNPAYVVARLYDSNKTAHYLKIRKMTVINSRTLSSQGAQQAFAQGSLWVSILEQAFLALDANGGWGDPRNPKFSSVVGSNTAYSALKAILGVDVDLQQIPDLADPASRASAFQANTDNDFGKNQTLFFEQAMNASEIKKTPVQNTVKMNVFGGRQDLFGKFLTWAQAKDMTAIWFGPPQLRPTHLDVFRTNIVSKPTNMIRYEDIEAFFKAKSLDGAIAQAVLAWIETNKVLPGKKFTKIYSHWEEWVFTRLKAAQTSHNPAILTTRDHIGTPEGLGASASEPKVKGLVAGHEYPLIDAEDDNGRKFVTVRNPWGEYGRTYVPDIQDKRPRAIAQDSAVSRLPLQEITKRFRRFQIAQKSLT